MKLILIEGIPGSGKTTTADNVTNYLRENKIDVSCYQEGDLHPCDLAWHAVIPVDKYEKIYSEYPEWMEALDEYSITNDDYVYIAHTKLGLKPSDELYKILKGYDIYNGNVSLDEFKYHHLNRWSAFAELNDDKVYVFECAFLQNHIVELMLNYQLDKKLMKEYLLDLIKTVVRLNPLLIYLSPQNVDWNINNVAKQRLSDNPDIWPDWIDAVITYIQNSNYGMEKGTISYEDVVDFFKDRKEFEEKIINQLPINSILYEINQDWDVIETILQDCLKYCQ